MAHVRFASDVNVREHFVEPTASAQFSGNDRTQLTWDIASEYRTVSGDNS